MSRRPWDLPEAAAAPEAAWINRRALLQGLGLMAAASGCRAGPLLGDPMPDRYPYALPTFDQRDTHRIPEAADPTEERAAAAYNNYYEFTTDKAEVWRLARDFQPVPWAVTVGGACHAPRTFGLEELLRFPHEQRVYRFRCVEAWSMVVPWVGFPLRLLLEAVQPSTAAKYVRLVTLDAPERFPGVREQTWYPWPYYEALSIAEATHDLTLLATGIYGHPLPNQHGAPLRLVAPWKYGYKNIKAIAAIELLTERPTTFWSDLVGEEYDFLGNVRPDVPHPRWSQATDRMIPGGERLPTPMYNGYAQWVAHLYPPLR